ncbi:DEAD/DEAH box helicase [Shewanella sp. FJAT-51649]|uniref:protein DpdF n=1 Tax=Shewanella sp. FJAT-51649 TaxID=2864210 RepID=UPI001C6598DA|nr:protein DpdF [Shewanella sp. FJAT-51649]QYJ70318.1 DEAD/DEAH box helicase [Shewanella sp. FJAT-51649]
MNMQLQWQKLQIDLLELIRGAPSLNEQSYSQFWQRLLILLSNPCSELDLLSGYRDALAASQALNLSGDKLPAAKEFSISALRAVGLQQDSNNNLSLVDKLPEYLNSIYQLEHRRKVFKVPFDGRLKQRLKSQQYQFYNGQGQALAVRAVLKAPVESALLVNLPTGCGKTLLIDAQVAICSQDQLVLVIVPTVALAMDQANRMRLTLQAMGEDHGGDYAWHSGLSVQSRAGIRERLENGEQRVLFCSPEAAKSALTISLFKLAKQQRLGALIIDEAHMLAHWGAEFRPEFQLIPPLLYALQMTSPRPIRHILMSATLTRSTVDVLKRLLPSEQQLIEVNGCFLRPEPDYHIEHCNSEKQHLQKVAHILTLLPRPMVVYTTKVDEATFWYSHLKHLGYQRVGLFTGETSKDDRQSLVDQWRNNQCDIMVATSAFGVGIDKANVRSVVHASVPESLDRYYQECGRGGRDGLACITYMLFHSGQIEVAQMMSQAKLIGDEKGFPRWQAMYERRKNSSVAEHAVSVNIVPAHVIGSNEKNSGWNWRTLLLMQRSGLLALRFEAPNPRRISENESDEEYEVYLGNYYKEYFETVHVDDLKAGHSSLDIWSTEVSKQRQRELDASRADFQAMLDILKNNDRLLCKQLVGHYQTDSWTPEHACGGCPGCRRANRRVNSRVLGEIAYSDFQSQNGFTASTYYPASTDIRALVLSLQQRLHGWLKSGQVQAIRTDEETRKVLYQRFQSNDLMWIDLNLDDANEYWHELVLLSPNVQKLHSIDPFGPNSILIAPDNLPDPKASYRHWQDCHPNAMPLSQFLKQ